MSHKPRGPSSSSSSTPDNAKEVTLAYHKLLARSHERFVQLRDLPQYGPFWQHYFQKTFKVFTNLWKFQQQHRAVLENPRHCDLQRWEIGDIASKIGQLYYHYYLRTSDVNYLQEAMIFYNAIRQRDYMKAALGSKRSLLVLKKLRYYARFIVVCLLLGKVNLVKVLVAELRSLVYDYVRLYEPPDDAEWWLVLEEIEMFLRADLLTITGTSEDLHPTYRLRLRGVPSSRGNPRLQEAIIVASYTNQIKFSELTLDMFRMMVSLERTTASSDGDPSNTSSKHSAFPKGGKFDMTNPHKVVLYKPSVAHLMEMLASATYHLREPNVILLYLSADGYIPDRSAASDHSGGVLLSSGASSRRHPASVAASSSSDASTHASYSSSTSTGTGTKGTSVDVSAVLSPEDLIPFTRQRVFLIVESSNSHAFMRIPQHYQHTVAALLSPTALPDGIPDHVFTAFLCSSLKGFLLLTGATEVNSEKRAMCESILEKFYVKLGESLSTTESFRDTCYFEYFDDDFLRFYLLRFVFCFAVFTMHKRCRTEASFLPCCVPELPSSVMSGSLAREAVISIAKALNVSDQFIKE